MPLNITQIENLVEAITDLQVGNDPSDDVPSNLVNAFIEEAYQRIFTLNTKWPWYQTIYELNTTANQRSYTTGFTQIATTATGTSVGSDFADIREIISATNESNGGNQLIYIDDFLAQKYWNGTADTPGNPIYFSMWAGELRLWPKPDSVYTINIRGFRQPSYAWLTNPGLTVDINDEFHIMIVNFVASRCYQFQEDPEMAEAKKQKYIIETTKIRIAELDKQVKLHEKLGDFAASLADTGGFRLAPSLFLKYALPLAFKPPSGF